METTNENYESQADGVWKKYRKQVESFEKGLVAKAVGTQPHHIAQLGKQLEQWENYKGMCEANGSLNTLGDLPKIALDVITATMGNSILPVISSTQALEAQKGIIYFKNIRSETTQGNLTAGEKVLDPRTGMKTPKGFSSNKIVGAEAVPATVDGQRTYAFSLGGPVRREFLTLATDIAGVFAEDVGPRGADQNIGAIIGAGLHGTVNYTTGAVSITFAENPTDGKKSVC